MVSRIASGAAADRMISGEKSSEQNSVLSSSTGITALFDKADFLQVSYAPNNNADRNASDSHILQGVYDKSRFGVCYIVQEESLARHRCSCKSTIFPLNNSTKLLDGDFVSSHFYESTHNGTHHIA